MFNKIAKFSRMAYWPMALIPIGIILIIVSAFAFNSVNITKNYEKTTAIVSKMELYEEEYRDDDGETHDATYTVFVKYTVDGTEYETEYGVFSGYKVGEKVKICYDKNDPTKIAQPNGIILPISLLAGGIAVLIGGIVTAIVAVKKNKKLKEQEKEWANEQ